MKPKTFDQICDDNPQIPRSELVEAKLRCEPSDYSRNKKGVPIEPLYSERCVLLAARTMRRTRHISGGGEIFTR